MWCVKFIKGNEWKEFRRIIMIILLCKVVLYKENENIVEEGKKRGE